MLAITGWDALSGWGIGRDAFEAGLANERVAKRAVDGEPWSIAWPIEEACCLPEFKVAEILGTRKGTRVLDRTAALAVGLSSLALADSGLRERAGYETTSGMVLGTCDGSISRTIDYTRETIGVDKPYRVSPEAFPNTVMNFAAGQCAIWHKLKALNTTISGGRLAMLKTLSYAQRMIQSGYADALVAGSVEELSPHLAWGLRSVAQGRGEELPLLGEGGAMFVVEPNDWVPEGRIVAAHVLSVRLGFAPRAASLAKNLAACIRQALDQAGLAPTDINLASVRAAGVPSLDSPEQAAIDEVFGVRAKLHRLAIASYIGDCYSASGALQLAGLIASLRARAASAPQHGIVTSLSHEGSLGCAIVRVGS